MNDRSLWYYTLILLICLTLLFFVDVRHIVNLSDSTPDVYLHHNDVQGITVVYNQLPYTLNFNQQNEMIDYLNRAIPVEDIEKVDQKPNISKIFIYTFGREKEIELDPLAYRDENLIFAAPKIELEGYLLDVSAGELKDLIATTHDS